MWLENGIKAVYEDGVKDDTLNLVFKMDQKAETVVKTQFGETEPVFMENLVTKGTVMGQVLNNCSLDRVNHEGQSYQDRVIQLKPLEHFVDDIADTNNGLYEARRSNDIIIRIQQQKRLTFAAHK